MISWVVVSDVRITRVVYEDTHQYCSCSDLREI